MHYYLRHWPECQFNTSIVSDVGQSVSLYRREPQNAAFKINETGCHTLHCTSNKINRPLYWRADAYIFHRRITKGDRLDPLPMHKGFQLNVTYYSDETAKSMDLKVPQKNMDFAGNYTCDINGQRTKTVRLVVLGMFTVLKPISSYNF